MSLKIGVIVGTTRPTRRGLKIAKWFLDQAKNQTTDLEFDLIDLKEENLSFLDEPQSPSSGVYEQESTKKWSEKIKGYDGFVFVVAEYNHGYPAPLKNAIDTLYNEWIKKPAAFVGYGGVGGARAIEQLAQVCAELQMMPLTYATSRVNDPSKAVGEDGTINPDFVRGNIEYMLKELSWWARTLKSARATDSAEK